MTQEPYRSAHRVFWIMDNCSAHRGPKAVQRIRSQWPNAILVHTPIHASWLNQIEIYFSIVQRKVLTPNDFLAALGLGRGSLRLRLAAESRGSGEESRKENETGQITENQDFSNQGTDNPPARHLFGRWLRGVAPREDALLRDSSRRVM